MTTKGVRLPMSQKFRDELRAYIKREGINQKVFAERVNTDESTISRLIRGLQTPKIDLLDRIAAAMDREVMELVYWYLDRPLPDVYVMAHRTNALSSNRRLQVSNFALALLTEQEEAEKHQQAIERKV